MVVPFMTLYLTQSKNFTIGQAGFVMALFGLGAICGAFLGGRLTDRLGFYNVQIGALLAGGLFFILLGQMQSFTAICIFSFVLSAMNDTFRPANSTAVAHYSKEENRTRSYALNRLAINVGWAVGGGLGGFIASKNYHLLFWIDGLTNIGAAILLLLVLSPKRSSYTPALKEKQPKPAATQSAYRDKIYIAFTVLVVLYAYSFFQLFSMVPLFYNKVLGLTPFYIGTIMAANGILIALLEMLMVFRLEGRRQNLQYISVGTLLIAASYLVYNILPGFGTLAIISMLISTVGEMLSMPFMNSFWVSRTNADNRGQYAGLYSMAWSVAQVLAPSTGAQIAEHFGFTTLWWFIGGMAILATVGFRWLYWGTKETAFA